jgi:Arm DNA-binding domain
MPHARQINGREAISIKFEGVTRTEYLGLPANKENHLQAKKWAKEIGLLIARGGYTRAAYLDRFPNSKRFPRTEPAPEVPTLRTFAAEWLTKRKPFLTPAAFADYKSQLDFHILTHAIADKRLDAITDTDTSNLVSRPCRRRFTARIRSLWGLGARQPDADGGRGGCAERRDYAHEEEATMTIRKMIDMAELGQGNVSRLLPDERPEALRRLSAGIAAIVAAPGDTAATTADSTERWLTPTETCAKYPIIKRRWLFKHRADLPFVRNENRKVMRVNEQGLLRWLARKG